MQQEEEKLAAATTIENVQQQHNFNPESRPVVQISNRTEGLTKTTPQQTSKLQRHPEVLGKHQTQTKPNLLNPELLNTKPARSRNANNQTRRKSNKTKSKTNVTVHCFLQFSHIFCFCFCFFFEILEI